MKHLPQTYENVENDVIALFPFLVRGSTECDYNHIDAFIQLTGDTIDIKQPSVTSTTVDESGNVKLAWAITVISDSGEPGALLSDVKYFGLTNLYKDRSTNVTICKDNKDAWLFLLERTDIMSLLSYTTYDTFKQFTNTEPAMNYLNETFNFSQERGIYFQRNFRGTAKYFIIVTEDFIKTWPKQFYYLAK